MRKPQKRFPAKKKRRIKGIKPHVKIIKRDGKVQPFSRDMMIKSIQNAGATQDQADLVTNRVSNRLLDRETIPSTEVSSMVARSLSHVNTTASRNYVDSRKRKLAYTQQVNRLSAEIAAINQRVHHVTNSIKNLDDRIQGLQGRIARVRQGNYRVLTHLEADHASLSEAWKNISQELRKTTSLKSEIVQTRINNLQQALHNKFGRTDYNSSNLQEIESGIPELRMNLSEIQNAAVNAMAPLEKRFENIDKDLRKAESTTLIVSQASFPWEEGESPIAAAKVKDLNNELDGFLILTNNRFIFESEKEIALKKVLFVVTEKKTVREVRVQKPIGMVSKLVHGKVGFFKGSGLFVEFVPESGLPEMKFDSSGQDAEWIVEGYNYIITGRAQEELASITPVTTADPEKLQLAVCPWCRAPYREKIYRGQTSVSCKYCGATIAIQQRS